MTLRELATVAAVGAAAGVAATVVGRFVARNLAADGAEEEDAPVLLLPGGEL